MSRRILLAAVVILLLAGVTYGATRPGFEEIPQAAADVTTTEAPTTTKAPTTTVAPTTTAPETTTTTAYVPPTTQYVPPTTVYVAPPTTVWVEPAYEEPAYEEPIVQGGGSGCVIPAYICERESGHSYTALNSSSMAGGMYQFIPSTWNAIARQIAPEWIGTYAHQAPPWVQDMFATWLWDGGAGASHWACC